MMKKICLLAGLFLLGLIPALASANVTVDDPDDEVQVGYGTLKRGELTTSIVSVDVEAMLKKNPTTVAKMIQGAAAGVDVSVSDGAPEENAAVIIRGISTVIGDTDPLWVVDGVVVDDISFLNPKDVEAIDILKDAAAQAIYSSSKGAILIKTRSGKECKTHVTASLNVGIQTLASGYDVVDANSLAKGIRQVYQDSGLDIDSFKPLWSDRYDSRRSTIDWQKELTRKAVSHSYLISAYGGNKKSSYNVSLGHVKNDGIMLGSGYQRFSAHAAAKSAVTKYLEVGASLNYAHGISDKGCRTTLSEVAAYTPSMDYLETLDGAEEPSLINVSTVNGDGSYGGGPLGTSPWANPLFDARNDKTEVLTDKFVASAYLDAIFFRNDHHSVDLKGIFGFRYNGISSSSSAGGANLFNLIGGEPRCVLEPGYCDAMIDNNYTFSTFNSSSHRMSLDTYLSYRMTYPKHSLSVVLGLSGDHDKGQYSAAGGSGFETADIRDINLAEVSYGSGAFTPVSRHMGYFGRLNYALMGRYIIGLSFSRVGSSNFGSGNRWGTFPSASLAWRISEENFFKALKPVFSELKIRAGWGQSGYDGNLQNQTSAVAYIAPNAYSFYHKDTDAVSAEQALVVPDIDPNLKWQTTESHNVGLDLGFLDGSLTASLDIYKNRTKDLLTFRSGRASAGSGPIYTNSGSILNSGFEFTLSYNKEFANGFGVYASFNGSTHKNKILSYNNGLPAYFTSEEIDSKYGWQHCVIAREGDPVGEIYGYLTTGALEDNVEYGILSASDFFVDLNGDGEIDSRDKTVLGNALPKFTYALNIALSYKNWDIAVYGYGAAGRKMLSYPALRLGYLDIDGSATPNNVLKKDEFQAVSLATAASAGIKVTEVSDLWVKKADYFRLSDVQLGYNFGEKVLKALRMSGMRLYLSVQNVALASPYKAYGDPETFGGSAALNSVDLGGYARPRTYMAGLNITF